MTTEFKLPEPIYQRKSPSGLWLDHSKETHEWCVKETVAPLRVVYTSSDIRAVIEQCAVDCEQAKDLYDASTLYAHVPGILQIRADRIRKLLEQVK